jgi:hypothetical protein
MQFLKAKMSLFILIGLNKGCDKDAHLTVLDFACANGEPLMWAEAMISL